MQKKKFMKNILLIGLGIIGFWTGISAQECNHESVDLGLPSGTLWANCNLGADTPSDYGVCYSWGSIQPEMYTENFENPVINNFTGNPKYDPATAAWGANWGTPTAKQAEELVSKCKWTWTRVNGIRGYKATGPNGNTLFFPATGVGMVYAGDNGITYGLEWVGRAGCYWTATDRRELYLGEVYNELDDEWERPVRFVSEDINGDFLRFVRPVLLTKK